VRGVMCKLAAPNEIKSKSTTFHLIKATCYPSGEN
jgi:hypothetical protein